MIKLVKMNDSYSTTCKYCLEKLQPCVKEGLTCTICSDNVHVRCLKAGTVPGGLYGDIFFIFTCQECSQSGQEVYVRDKISWLKILILVLYHLQTASPGLAKRGFFHWRNHVASFVDKNWEILFPKDVKRKKKWIGTIAGTLSHFSSIFFRSGTTVFNEPAWWALSYPKMSPKLASDIYTLFTIERQKMKAQKLTMTDMEIFQKILDQNIEDKELLNPHSIILEEKPPINISEEIVPELPKKLNNKQCKRKTLLPPIQSTSRKLMKLNRTQANSLLNDLTWLKPKNEFKTENLPNKEETTMVNTKKSLKLLDPMCHYNTSLKNMNSIEVMSLRVRLMGNTRLDFIVSPYSGVHIPPYIRRDTETYSSWIKLMNEIRIVANRKNHVNVTPFKYPLDYVYVQPEHIPAINSLCNNFFWPGIDLSDCLQYPEYSCVVMYRKLIVGFAFMVPNLSENYISFLFTRPGWRNCGIARFMIYHLTQVSLGKDITLHVSIGNPALFLYQKFGFKVESVVINFYDKYLRHDTKESKHAFFCRLER